MLVTDKATLGVQILHLIIIRGCIQCADCIVENKQKNKSLCVSRAYQKTVYDQTIHQTPECTGKQGQRDIFGNPQLNA